MQIDVYSSWHGEYRSAVVRHGDDEIDIGLLDESDRKQLAITLRDAADELMDGLDEEMGGE